MLIPRLSKTLVMPLQNGTQKEEGRGPDFRRDDGRSRDNGKSRDDGTKNNKNLAKLSCKNKIF